MQQSSVPLSATTAEIEREASTAPDRHFHTVQFYENEQFLAAAVSDFLADGLSSGQVVIVIATPAHRQSFELRLKAKALDVDSAAQREQLLWLDARETLATFMVQSTPDRERAHDGCADHADGHRLTRSRNRAGNWVGVRDLPDAR